MGTERNLRSSVSKLAGKCAILGLCLLANSKGVLAVDHEWRLEPSLTLSGYARSYDSTESDAAKWIGEVAPSINAVYKSGLSEAALLYTPRFLFTDLSEARYQSVQTLVARVTHRPSASRFSFFANANVNEAAFDPLAPMLTTSVFSTQRVRTFAANAGASFKETVVPGMLGEGKLSLSFSEARGVNTAEVLGTRTERALLSFDMRPIQDRPESAFGGGGEFGYRATNTTADAQTYRAHGTVFWNPSSQYGARARVGYEKMEFIDRDNESKGLFIDVGGEWRFGSRVSVKGEIGRHFFGAAGELSAHYRDSRSAFEFLARRSVINTQDAIFLPSTNSTSALLDLFLRGTMSDPIQRASEVQRLTTAFGLSDQLAESRYFYVDRFMLEQLVRISGVYNLPRTSFSATAQFRRLDPGSSDADALRQILARRIEDLASELQVGYRLSSSLVLNAKGNLTRSEIIDGGTSTRRVRMEVKLTRTWSPSLTTSVAAYYDRQNSNEVRYEFTDTGIVATVHFSFY